MEYDDINVTFYGTVSIYKYTFIMCLIMSFSKLIHSHKY